MPDPQKDSRGIAKLVKALDFDSSMRRFESFFPCHFNHGANCQVTKKVVGKPHM